MSVTRAVEERFDRAAAQWDENPARVAHAQAIAEAMRRAVPLRSDMSVLDFGCGTGLLSLALQPHVGRIVGADASREMLRVLEGKLAARQIANVSTWHGDIAVLPPEAGSFDLVASSLVLHHLPDVPAVLARLGACLRPGGWVALADLDAEDGTFHPDPAGVFHHGFARPQLAGWLAQAGFTEVAVRDAHRIPRGDRVYGVFLATGRR